MCNRVHCHNLVGLWFLSLHWGFLLCIGGYAEDMLVGCAWWCASRVFWCVLWLWFLAVHGAGPSTLDYVLSYLFS